MPSFGWKRYADLGHDPSRFTESKLGADPMVIRVARDKTAVVALGRQITIIEDHHTASRRRLLDRPQ